MTKSVEEIDKLCKINEKVLRCRFNHMKRRCYSEKDKQYKNYGARGIKIFDEWLDDKYLFIKFCMENGFNTSLSIDRIDNDGNYEPSNIRFTDSLTQNNNTRSNIIINDSGDIITISQFCRKHNIESKKVYAKLSKVYQGDTEKMHIDFLNGELFKVNSKITVIVNGEEMSLREVSEKYNISIKVIRSRYKRKYRGDLLIRPLKNYERTA